jgi:hypothetical protein
MKPDGPQNRFVLCGVETNLLFMPGIKRRSHSLSILGTAVLSNGNFYIPRKYSEKNNIRMDIKEMNTEARVRF